VDRSFYYMAIAFFGMVNGLFNSQLHLFARFHTHLFFGAALFFGSQALVSLFASLMVSTATIIVAGIPAAIYERLTGAREDSTIASLWVWLAGTALLTMPVMGNFFATKL
jgi:hypothetical protein